MKDPETARPWTAYPDSAWGKAGAFLDANSQGLTREYVLSYAMVIGTLLAQHHPEWVQAAQAQVPEPLKVDNPMIADIIVQRCPIEARDA